MEDRCCETGRRAWRQTAYLAAEDWHMDCFCCQRRSMSKSVWDAGLRRMRAGMRAVHGAEHKSAQELHDDDEKSIKIRTSGSRSCDTSCLTSTRAGPYCRCSSCQQLCNVVPFAPSQTRLRLTETMLASTNTGNTRGAFVKHDRQRGGAPPDQCGAAPRFRTLRSDSH